MANIDITIEICGMSGDGTIAAGVLLNAALTKAGYYLLAFDSYPAEIRGFGRCVTHSRIGSSEMMALKNKAHVLISLDDEQSRSRIANLEETGVMIFDNRPLTYVGEHQSIAAHAAPETRLFGVPFGDLSAKATGSRRGRNLSALGAFAALYGVPADCFESAIEKKFASKGSSVLKANLACFEAGYQYVSDAYKEDLLKELAVEKAPDTRHELLVSGNEAVAKAALDAGLKLYFGYPITPATPVMEILAKSLPEKGGEVMQMEDEISSIGAVIGAFFAGKRSMTATSGPGFALMTELIGHATVTETPAVIVNAQRGGPATGLPTKTEQSDLQAAVYGGGGDSARIVIAPTNVKECYHYTVKSFQYAEKYQTPVIVLTDFFLHNRVESVDELAAPPVDLEDWNVYPSEETRGRYHRYHVTENGISPRSIPGMEGYIFATTGLEHTERGLPDYSPDVHMKMSKKRHDKLQSALADLPEPAVYAPDGKLDVGIISWGSTFGSALEAAKTAQKQQKKVGALKIASIFPYHADIIKDFMDQCDEVLVVELNYEGQLANLIGHLHRKEVKRLNRVTGIPVSPMDILDKLYAMGI